MIANSTIQRFNQGDMLPTRGAARQIGQSLRVLLSGNHRLQHRPAADPQNLGHHRGKFDVSVLQHLLNAIDGTRPFFDEISPKTGEIPQSVDAHLGNEAPLDESVLHQFEQQLDIADICLASGNHFDMPGAKEHDGEHYE